MSFNSFVVLLKQLTVHSVV